MSERSDEEVSQSPSGTYHSLNQERTRDLGACPWEKYLLYVLEVDESDVNTDGLEEISDVFRSLQPDTDRFGGESDAE